MLPWMTVYDHTNYARWGTIYLAEMKYLETSQPIIHQEFMNGNFIVRCGKGRFNQVPIDQVTEWQNRVCKISNGIIGITRNDTATDKFCITWAERSYISHSTRCLLEIENEDEDQLISTRKDAQPSRIRLDKDSVTKLEEVFTVVGCYAFCSRKRGLRFFQRCWCECEMALCYFIIGKVMYLALDFLLLEQFFGYILTGLYTSIFKRNYGDNFI
jgi:hypothetical protein